MDIDIGTNIRILCLKNKITVKELEKELGLGHGTIYKWTKVSPTLQNLLKVSSYFNCTVSDIIGDNK